MDPDPPLQSSLVAIPFIILLSFLNFLVGFIALVVLIILSAMISGSEVAYFSFSPQDEADLDDDESPSVERIKKLKKDPEKLLATILVSNNLVNISIVIVSDQLLRSVFGPQAFDQLAGFFISVIGDSWMSIGTLSQGISFVISVVLVTFILVLFGEVAPKIYANLNNISFAKTMSLPLTALTSVFGPVSNILVSWSSRIEKKVDQQKANNSSATKEELDKAIELASEQMDDSPEQVGMLKGILKFGDVAAKQIMKPRGDVVSLNIDIGFKELIGIIKEAGYSRLPVYREDFDELVGILYVKDLLGLSEEADDFKWQDLIREGILYVPESKKINELLKEFQTKRTHMAIVVDEYGGASGIITLEDILEEVIGDIKDEFDETEEVEYVKLSENHYVFEGKTLINDFCRIIDEEIEFFDNVKGDADSLAGLLLELTGFIPKPNIEINHEHFRFKVISVTKRRIEKVNVFISK